MADCKNITHPFLTDPGVSQRQRVMENLLSGPAQIDARSLADLLDFFVQLSAHINYYNEQMEISDWRPFFDKSIPFTLAGIIKYDCTAIENKLKKYKTAFEKKPSVYGLQLLLNYAYDQYIRRIDQWQVQLNTSGLPVEQMIERIIKDKASEPVKNFIKLANTATKWYCTKNFNFSELQKNPVWKLAGTDPYQLNKTIDENRDGSGKKLILLYNQIVQTVAIFPGLIRIIATSASMNLEQSLLPLNEELKQRNPPHLAVLFAFLKMFITLQGDLNKFKKNHLDYFYKQVLQLQPKQPKPDKIHVVAEIQKQLDQYRLKKGTLLKGGKDLNKEEILFSLDDDIIINKTQIADQRTLFLHNVQVRQEMTLLEGVYMATDATKANGIDKEFKDDTLPSRAALGAKWSKYTDPENKFIYAYPKARIGFVLASPVLLLNEGRRKITITLNFTLNPNYCSTLKDVTETGGPCCTKTTIPVSGINEVDDNTYTPFKPAGEFFSAVSSLLNKTYCYISRPLIAAAVKKGISKVLEKGLYDLLVITHIRPNFKGEDDWIEDDQICYCPKEEKLFDRTILYDDFKNRIGEDQLKSIAELFVPQKAFIIQFSGEKAWIPAPEDTTMEIDEKNSSIRVVTQLSPDKPAVTFYNAETLKEDLNTTLPLVKIELNDKIKLTEAISSSGSRECCERNPEKADQNISLYHFFRNIILQNETRIDVEVCGLKQVIVQNDESLQDVNAPIFAFGTRPKVGASFYIGSKEVFSKNWQRLYVNAEWKDRPDSFEEHYKNYSYPGFEIKDDSFKMETAVLDNGIWKKNEKSIIVAPPTYEPVERAIFRKITNPPIPLLDPSFCDRTFDLYEEAYDYKREDEFPRLNDYQKVQDIQSPFLPLNVSSRYGFIRFTLKGFDFQHDAYPFVLAKQMLAYVDLLSPAATSTLVQKIKEGWALTEMLKDRLNGITNSILALTTSIPSVITSVGKLITDITDLSNKIKDIEDSTFDTLSDQWEKLDINFQALTADLGTFVQDIKTPIDNAVAELNKTNPDVEIVKNELSKVTPDLTNINTLMTLIKNNLNEISPLIGDLIKLKGIKGDVTAIKDEAKDIQTKLEAIKVDIDDLDKELTKNNPTIIELVVVSGEGSFEKPFVFDRIAEIGINRLAQEIQNRIEYVIKNLKIDNDLKNGLPKEPYTPVIKSLSVNYSATSDINDIDLIHLYPYPGTYKPESLTLQPTLLPTFCDEGSLFIGLKELVPGSSLNILFQLAEATADSEAPPELIKWYYLENNTWKLLRNGFEIVNDDTNGLTISGIITFLLPANMTNENTILPKGLHWIKASIPKNSSAVGEIISLHTQAIKATFTNKPENDKSRFAIPLPEGSVSKLEQADASITKIIQPYNSFGGSEPEETAHFYIRASELLRHKNRAIQKFDYERMALEFFPELFKVKCINHSYFLNAHQFVKDFTIAPGYVMLAVIPDLNRLKAAAAFEPKVPVSLMEKIALQLKNRTSPFVRLKVVNPRYEKVNFCLQIKLLAGKDENYYKERLKNDLSKFLAPWAIGEYDKLTFGQPINRSDIVRFLEGRDYLDYIIELKMRHADDTLEPLPVDQQEIIPLTPRSILVAGNIDICINQGDCAEWTESVCKNKLYNINNYTPQVGGINK